MIQAQMDFTREAFNLQSAQAAAVPLADLLPRFGGGLSVHMPVIWWLRGQMSHETAEESIGLRVEVLHFWFCGVLEAA